jgi:hypothetical protein
VALDQWLGPNGFSSFTGQFSIYSELVAMSLEQFTIGSFEGALIPTGERRLARAKESQAC